MLAVLRRVMAAILLVTVLVGYGMHRHNMRRNVQAMPLAVRVPSDESYGIVHLEALPTTPPFMDEIEAHRRLFDAIRAVEGSKSWRIGSAGERGPYQITRAYWQDACEYAVQMGYLQEPWDYDTLVWHAPYCEQIMCWYWQRYRATSNEQAARLHNGGPGGPTNPKTLDYWHRVRALMEAEK